MILIADSGSTQTKWAGVAGEATRLFRTPGMNPYYQTEAEMEETIRRDLLPQLPPEARIEAIYFYGAGCAFPEKNRSVERAIRANIPARVMVRSDLWAAAHALCGTEAGIPCILGTGSNSCLYDGQQIREQVSPLGFILGDEGSGAVLGKLLVGDCLKGLLPPEISRRFLEECCFGRRSGVAVLSLEEEQAVYHCLSAERFASFRQKQLAFFTEVLEVFGAPAGRVDPMLFGNTALAMMMVRKAIPEQMPFLFPEAADAMVRFQIDALVAALEAARGEDAPRKETPHDTDA